MSDGQSELVFGDDVQGEYTGLESSMEGQTIQAVELAGDPSDGSVFIVIQTDDYTIYADSPSIYRKP